MTRTTVVRLVVAVSLLISATLITPAARADAATIETRTFTGTAVVHLGTVLQTGSSPGVLQTATITISRPGRKDWNASFQGLVQTVGGLIGFGGPLTMTTARPTHLYGTGAIFQTTSGGNLTAALNITGSDGEFVSGQLATTFPIGSVGLPMTGSLVVQTH